MREAPHVNTLECRVSSIGTGKEHNIWKNKGTRENLLEGKMMGFEKNLTSLQQEKKLTSSKSYITALKRGP